MTSGKNRDCYKIINFPILYTCIVIASSHLWLFKDHNKRNSKSTQYESSQEDDPDKGPDNCPEHEHVDSNSVGVLQQQENDAPSSEHHQHSHLPLEHAQAVAFIAVAKRVRKHQRKDVQAVFHKVDPVKEVVNSKLVELDCFREETQEAIGVDDDKGSVEEMPS